MVYKLIQFILRIYLPVVFKRLEFRGLENVPQDKPVIFAVNHQNAFLDGILVALKLRRPVFFLTRSDVFKGRWVVKIFKILNLVPIFRRQDGAGDITTKNRETFKYCIKELEKKKPILIFPEGESEPIHHLFDLKKGVARLAFEAEAKNNFKLGLHVVPVVINYENHFVPGKKVFVNYSNYETRYSLFTFIRMIIISEFMKEYGFEKVFSNDSDNLLLKNINEYTFKKDSALCIPTVWEPFYFATSVHSALISKSFCEEYERMYVDVFVNKSRLPLFEQKIEYHNSNPGSFCDMTFYHFLNDLNLVEAENLLKPKLINGEEYTFVNNYANGEGPESKNQYKVNRKGIKIYTNKKLQTNKIYDTINKNYLGIFNMHYQGKHKKYLNKSLLKKLVF